MCCNESWKYAAMETLFVVLFYFHFWFIFVFQLVLYFSLNGESRFKKNAGQKMEQRRKEYANSTRNRISKLELWDIDCSISLDDWHITAWYNISNSFRNKWYGIDHSCLAKLFSWIAGKPFFLHPSPKGN